MDKLKIIRSPSVKRRNRQVPVHQRATLERVIGLTAGNNATLACDTNTGNVAYPAGCVVVLFNPKGNKQTHIFNSSKKTITSLAFSPDGNHVVTGESGHQPAVRVWEIKERTQVAEFHGHKFGIVCVKFSPNHKYLVSIGSQHDMMVNVWNWKTGTKVASNKISSKINSMAFSKDGSMFVTVGNRHVKFWYLDSSKSRINETVPLNGRSGILGDQKNNYFCDIACGKGKTVYCITQSGRLCQFNEKRLLDKWVELRTTSATCISAGDEYIFIGCANGVVRVFDTQTLHYVTTLPHPHPLGVDVASALSPSQMVCHIPDAKFPDTIALVFDDCHKKVTCVYNDHSLYMWDVRDVKKVGKSWSFLYHSSCIWGLEVCPPVTMGSSPVLPPGSFITCSSDDTIRIWNLEPHMTETNSCKRNVYSHELLKVLYIDPSHTYLRDVDYNPAGGTDKTDTNYDGKNGIRCVVISSDGKHLASGDRIGNIRVHNLSDMKTIKLLEAHDQEVLCLQYANLKSAPNLLASSSRDRLVHVFDADQDYGLLQTLDDHSSTVTAIKFTDNESQLKMLSSSADKSVLFRNAQEDPTFQFVLGNQHVVGNNTLYDMDIEPSHKFVATACQDRNIRIYNIKSAKQKKMYRGTVGDSGVLIKLQLDPSGLYAATSCTDKNLCIIDFCTGELIATMFGHSEFATGVKFMNDLKHLISVSGDGCIFIWRLPKEMTEQMKSRLEALGKELPVEAMSYNSKNSCNKQVFDESLGRPPLFPNEQEFKTPTRIIAELTREREEREKSEEPPAKQSLDFRYSVGQLPKWAKAKLGESNPKSPEDQTKNLPKGKWAERVDNKGLISQLDGKLVEAESNFDQKAKKFAGDDSTDGRRETMILPKAENTPRKVPVISDDSLDGGDDDDDDEDFFPSFHKKNGSGSESHWTKPRMLSFNSQEDLQDDADFDPEVIYPPSEASLETNESVYTVFTGMDDSSKSRRNSLKTLSSDKHVDGESSSTDPVSPEELEDDDDSSGVLSTPVTPCDDFVHKTPDREKFLKETFENLSFTPIESDKFQKGLDELEKQINNVEQQQQQGNMFTSRQSFSTKFLSKAQQATIRNMAVYTSVQRQDGWFDSLQKKKDEMARAVDETRKRLMAMGWKEDSPDGDQSDRELSPELPSPPIKLTSKEENEFPQEATETPPTVKSTQQDPPKSPHMPKSLRRCWSTFDLPKHPILEEKPPVSLHYSKSNPNTPVSKKHGKNVSLKTNTKLAADYRPQWRSRIPTPTAYIQHSPRTNPKRVSIWDRPSESDSEESTSNIRSTPVNTSRQSRPTTLRLIKENNRRKHEAAEQAAKNESKYGQRSQSLSSVHRKQTESSKVKFSKAQSTLNLHQRDEKRGGSKSTPGSNLSKSSSMQNLNNVNTNAKSSGPKTKAKLKPSSKASHYASSPNLIAGLDVIDNDDVDFSSNLQLASDLSLSNSTPDLLEDDCNKVSQTSEKKKVTKSQTDTKRFSTGTPSRKNTKSDKSDTNKTQGRWSLPGKRILSNTRNDNKKDDKDLMPPPSISGVGKLKTNNLSTVSKSKQDTFLKRATQARKKSSDLTLDQAKDILRGKSGILNVDKSSSSDTSVSNSSSVAKVTVPSFSDDNAIGSISDNNSSTKTIPKVTSPPLHLNNNFLEIASEIEITADEIHRKSLIDSAFQNLASLDASPNDLPERDCDPPYSNAPSYLSMTPECSVNITSISTTQNSQDLVNEKTDGINDSWTSNITSQSSDNEEMSDKPSKSVKDRIAQLNKQISPRSPAVARASSPKITPSTPMTTSSSSIKISPSSNMSPRSSGVGSSLDSEAAGKIFNGFSPPSDSEDLSNKNVNSVVTDEPKRMSLENALGAVSSTYTSDSNPVTHTTPGQRQMPSISNGRSTPVSSGRSSTSSMATIGGSSPVPCSPRKADDLYVCMEALKELRSAVKKVSNLYSEVSQREESSEALKMLEEGFKEVQKTLTEIQVNPGNTATTESSQVQSHSSLQTDPEKISPSELPTTGYIKIEQLLPLFAKNNEILMKQMEKMFADKFTSQNSIG